MLIWDLNFRRSLENAVSGPNSPLHKYFRQRQQAGFVSVCHLLMNLLANPPDWEDFEDASVEGKEVGVRWASKGCSRICCGCKAAFSRAYEPRSLITQSYTLNPKHLLLLQVQPKRRIMVGEGVDPGNRLVFSRLNNIKTPGLRRRV